MADTSLPVTPGTGTNVNGFTTPDGDFNQAVVPIDPTTGVTGGVAANNSTSTGVAGNAILTGGTGFSTATITLNSGTPSTSWYDLLNYPWVSVEILTNTTPATITFQTSGDSSQTNVRTTPLVDSQSINGLPSTTTTSANGTFYGPRTGRYFRINSSAAGTVTLVITFYTQSPTVQVVGSNANVSSNTNTQSTAPSAAFFNGMVARTSLPSATTSGQLVGNMSDKYGRTVVVQGTIRDLVGTQTTTLSNTTTETTIVTAAASTFNDLTALIVSNTSSTSTRVDFRDVTAGTVLFSLQIPGNDVRGVTFQRPIPQTTVNTAWTAQCATAVTDLRIYAVFDKNA